MLRRVLVLLLVAAAVVFAVVAVRGVGSRVDVSKFLSSSLEQCSGVQAGRSSSGDPVAVTSGPAGGSRDRAADLRALLQCWSPALDTATASYGPRPVLAGLAGLVDPGSVFFQCHDAAHRVAAAAFALQGATRAAGEATLDCTSGYLDGLVVVNVAARQAQVREAGGLAADVDAAGVAAVHEVCDVFVSGPATSFGLLTNCYHGFGHVTWDASGGRLDEAFDRCRALDADAPAGVPQRPSWGCFGGAAMGLLDDPAAMSRNGLSFPAQGCLLLQRGERGSCLDQTAVLDAHARGGPEQFWEFCVAEADVVGHCASMLVQAGLQLGDVPGAFAACDAAEGAVGKQFGGLCAQSLLLAWLPRFGSQAAAVREACRVVPGWCPVFEGVPPIPPPPSDPAAAPAAGAAAASAAASVAVSGGRRLGAGAGVATRSGEPGRSRSAGGVRAVSGSSFGG